jgi:hypothetical protein
MGCSSLRLIAPTSTFATQYGNFVHEAIRNDFLKSYGLKETESSAKFDGLYFWVVQRSLPSVYWLRNAYVKNTVPKVLLLLPLLLLLLLLLLPTTTTTTTSSSCSSSSGGAILSFWSLNTDIHLNCFSQNIHAKALTVLETSPRSRYPESLPALPAYSATGTTW